MERLEPLAAAEKAYERGFARRALVGALPAVVVAAAAVALARPPLVAVALVSAVVVFLYLGRGFARGVWTGVIVGLVPCFAPVIARVSHQCVNASCDSICVLVCGIGGLIAGVLVGTAARGDLRRAGASIVCAGLMGALGCATLGMFAVVGMALALLSAGAVPALVARRA